MELKNLITTDKVIEVEHPLYEGLKVKLAYIPRETLKKYMERATISTFDKMSRKLVEEVDNDLFMKLYVPDLIKSWSGFKYRYLEELLPVDLSKVDDLDEELPYTEDNAIELMKNSSEFDEWISSIVRDVKNFNKNS